MEILPSYSSSFRGMISTCEARPYEKSAVKAHALSGKMSFLYHAIKGVATFCAIVIASCVSNSAIHNGAQPPMGSIMLKCAGMLLALFTAYVTFGGTAGVMTSLGLGHTIADITGCLTSAYVLYFAFSHP